MQRKQASHAIQPTRSENYPDWYQAVLKAADLAEHSPVRGCMIIKPWGYGIWENIQKALDEQLKATGHQNAYFPLMIPLSFLEKEAAHVEGFAKECAVVTHHRLEKNQEGKLVPAGELEEPLVVRPTSEMMIGHAFSKWIKSYRDLPLLINQWANVVRWEMRTRLFLRTTEFLWQEGHTAHATRKEAEEEAEKILHLYANFCNEYLAVPVIIGEKTEQERFPGAIQTFTIEAMMQDGKALQAGTSHFLGQSFSRSCEILFQNQEGEREHAWTSSWGVTTRLIGGLVMTHSDDDGLVLPPKVSPLHVVVTPIIHKEEARSSVMQYCEQIAAELKTLLWEGQPVRILIDTRDMRAGEKKWHWIKKGVPLRLEIGLREVETGDLCLFVRDDSSKKSVSRNALSTQIVSELMEMQSRLFQKALTFREKHTFLIDSKDDFYDFFSSEEKKGFALSHWNGDPRIEQKIKEDLNVTIRCIPQEGVKEEGSCFMTKEKSPQRVLFAKAY